jgi:hypothetical protein
MVRHSIGMTVEAYRSEDEAFVGMARQLADAFEEARSDSDREYAADAIADFLSDHDEYAPEGALLVFLALPMASWTWPLIDRAQTVLACRGADVVWALVHAAAGKAEYDPEGRAPARARETLRAMRDVQLVRGLVDVLGSATSDDVKTAAVVGLVEVGDVAVATLEAALSDPLARRWVEEALDGIRDRRG